MGLRVKYGLMSETTGKVNPAPDENGFIERMDLELSGWGDPKARIMRALSGDEFVLYAQPIQSLKGARRFEMAELLVRLREEEAAMLPPGEFFPVFEHYGMMPQLDRWVVRHAVARLARGSGVHRFSINVSGQTLGDGGFCADVAAELERGGVDAAKLVFELDESDVLMRPELAARFAAGVKKLGCKLLIDSFGRRAVSFAPLKEMRVDFVKVDGGIVRSLVASAVARTKLDAVVRVGDVIVMGVIAECVEGLEVLDLVKKSGAGYAQGFGIKRPAPIDTVAESVL
jgi:EAL domain-containing protein (putative c-di-GMP-specific phosphodiesterase class I)